MIDLATIGSVAIPTAVFTAGVAWGAVRQSLNGTRTATRETRAIVEQLVNGQAVTRERVAALEAKTDLILNSVLGDKK